MTHEATTQSPTQTIHLGNCWLIAATIASELLSDVDAEPGAPFVLSIGTDGDLTATPPGHPHYEDRLVAPGMVCTADRSMGVERLAGRIRDAALQLRKNQ